MALLTEKDKAEMAARADVRRKQNAEVVREQIQAIKLIQLLQDHALGKGRAKMTPAKLKAIEMLLERSVPTLSSVKHEIEAKTAVFQMTTVYKKPEPVKS
jgi:hypothetical protein